MGSTNFLPFNPTQTNQENDSAWNADSIRSGGVAVDDILPSPFLNKLWYQANGGVYALMSMMASKGFTVNDTNLATLAAVLANILTTADVPIGLQSPAWAGTLAFNAAKYGGFQVTLGGTTTFTISGQTAGQLIGLLWLQDATGGRTVTYPGNVLGGAQPDPAPNVLSAQLFKVNAALTLEAVGPVVSVNGMFFPGNVTVVGSVTAGSYNGLPPLAAVQSAASYVPGVTYTNSTTHPLLEEVSVNVTGPTGQAGSDNYMAAFVNGVLVGQNGVWNDCNGVCSVTFMVPAGATFEVILTHVGGGGNPSLASWVEVAL